MLRAILVRAESARRQPADIGQAGPDPGIPHPAPVAGVQGMAVAAERGQISRPFAAPVLVGPVMCLEPHLIRGAIAEPASVACATKLLEPRLALESGRASTIEVELTLDLDGGPRHRLSRRLRCPHPQVRHGKRRASCFLIGMLRYADQTQPA